VAELFHTSPRPTPNWASTKTATTPNMRRRLDSNSDLLPGDDAYAAMAHSRSVLVARPKREVGKWPEPVDAAAVRVKSASQASAVLLDTGAAALHGIHLDTLEPQEGGR